MSHHYVKFDNVHYRYPDGFEALRGVSFLITHGEKVALVGANGAGKSTLMLHMNGLLQATEGSVVIGDVMITRKTLPEIRRTVGLVFQNPDDQLFMPTVEEDVAFGPRNMKLTEDEVDRRVTRALEAVGAKELRHQAPYRLSGGQKRSVAIATVLSMEPDILVLDEPSSNLDPHARRLLIKQIQDFYHTVIVTSHDLDLVRRTCPRTIIMSHGEIIADGPTDALLDDEALMTRAGL